MTSYRSNVTLIQVTSEKTDDWSLRNNIVINDVTSKSTRHSEHREDGCHGNKYDMAAVIRCGRVVVGCIVTTVVIIIIHSTSLVEVAPIDVLLKVGSVGQMTSG